jgi:hypothetical protein
MINQFLTEGIIVFSLLLAFFSVMKVYSNKRKAHYLTNFSDYASVLAYHMQKAYDMIHKDRILTYSLEGMRLNDKDFDRVTEEFVKLVIKLLGPMLYKEFVFLYGDEDTLVFNIVEFFNSKYDDDEVRRGALENISSEDQEENK